MPNYNAVSNSYSRFHDTYAHIHLYAPLFGVGGGGCAPEKNMRLFHQPTPWRRTRARTQLEHDVEFLTVSVEF